ncbi:MAG: hypothetical protein RR495_01255 [Anaerovoracaceae bacterium]
MKIMELLGEIEEIIDTASGVPLTGKVMIESNEILEIVKEIRDSLPDEIHQAQWIQSEKDRILSEAKNEYEVVVADAKRHAESLVEKDEILTKTRRRAEELMQLTEANIKQLKMSTYDYVDGILYNFQEKMDKLNNLYFNDMFNNLENTFAEVNHVLATNRDEIKDMAYNTQIGTDLKNNYTKQLDREEG